MFMKRILVTGGTGFVGGALIFAWLRDGHCVTALSRNDPSGARTLASVRNAAVGFGEKLTASDEAHLAVRDFRFTTVTGRCPSDSFDESLFADIHEVWHAAAEMSFSPGRLAECAHQNITVTAALHRAISRYAPRCKRFYDLSTAFTAGNAGGTVYEELHTSPILVNAYQVSKWGAEMALAAQHPQGVPVTLVRTTGVVGHRANGWAGESHFGLYLFVDAILKVKAQGYRHLRLEMSTDARPNLVPIDVVVEVCRGLSARVDQGHDLEIFHCVGDAVLTTGQILTIVGDVIELPIHFAPLETEMDRLVSQGLAAVRAFVEIHWDWDCRALTRVLPEFVPPPVDEILLRSLVRARTRWHEPNAPAT
jgi:nucleoside-diphosphate-sugar epimerase